MSRANLFLRAVTAVAFCAACALLLAFATPAHAHTAARTKTPTPVALSGSGATTAPLLQRATVRTTTITVTWARDLRHATMLCEDRGLQHSAAGCAWGTTEDCRIVVVQPKDFDDHSRLGVLGHEVWHCLGARHE